MAKINPFQTSTLFFQAGLLTRNVYSTCPTVTVLFYGNSVRNIIVKHMVFVSRSGMETHSKVLRQTSICRGQLKFKENTGKANWLETEKHGEKKETGKN